MESRIKKIISYKDPVKNAPSDYEFWKKQSYEDRIAAIELLRKQFYDETTPRLQKVMTIIKKGKIIKVIDADGIKKFQDK